MGGRGSQWSWPRAGHGYTAGPCEPEVLSTHWSGAVDWGPGQGEGKVELGTQGHHRGKAIFFFWIFTEFLKLDACFGPISSSIFYDFGQFYEYILVENFVFYSIFELFEWLKTTFCSFRLEIQNLCTILYSWFSKSNKNRK